MSGDMTACHGEGGLKMYLRSHAGQLLGLILATSFCFSACGELSQETMGSKSSYAEGDPVRDPHSIHMSVGFNCNVCHSMHGGMFSFSQTFTLPGGTTTAGGTFNVGSGATPTTCTVECHYPFGGAAQSISWDMPGPLACATCHTQVATSGPALSSHPAAEEGLGMDCSGCHDTVQHLTGNINLVGGINATCLACHSGTGQTIGDNTGPVVSGFNDAQNGDWHGTRAGSGFGGTLLAPYAVGQDALDCTTCHTPHSSGNPYLLASTVNRGNIAAASITRAGVGAEMLCENCHVGDRHAGCTTSNCHGTDPAPAGAACFYCHGHQGIRNFVMPSWDSHPYSTANDCSHCHANGWMPDTITVTAPLVLSGPTVSVTETGATITWRTNVPVDGAVEYGTDTPGLVTTTAPGLTSMPTITLTGLSAQTAYIFRIRSTDGFRNSTKSSVQSFVTLSNGAGSGNGSTTGPMLQPVADSLIDATTGLTTTTIQFQWNRWIAGDLTEQYHLQLSQSADFSTLEADVWVDELTWQIDLPVTQAPGIVYYWRVQAADTTITSPWSNADSFTVYWYDPWGW